MALDLSKFVIVKHVTRPLLKMIENGEPVYILIQGPFRLAEQMKNPKKVKQTQPDGSVIDVIQPPPTIVDVLNIVTDTPSQMVANEVFRSEVSKQYPNESYVGKYFQLKKNTKAEGKNYNTFDITELRPETESDKEPVKDAAKTPAKK